MIFYSDFSDITGRHYEIEINTHEGGETKTLTMAGKPCVIKTANGSLFSPIKSRSCQMNILSTEWFFDLYEPESRKTTVKIYEYDEEAPLHVGKVIFKGYLTPCAYDQTFTYMDEITLNAIDGISTSKDYKWTTTHEYMTFFDIVMEILRPLEYKNIYIPQSYTRINTSQFSDTVLHNLYASSDNFIDDDEEKTPWTEYEVMEEIMQFMGWTFCPDGEDVWLVDYRAEANAKDGHNLTYKKYDISTGLHVSGGDYVSTGSHINVNLDITAGGTANVSIDDIYNKISISDNLYEIEDISPDVTDDNIHISVTDEAHLGYEGSKWTKTSCKEFLWWTWDEKTEVIGQTFQTLCRFKPSSGWKHHFYRMDEVGTRELTIADEIINSAESGWQGKNYHDPALTNKNNEPSNYTSGINGIMNTHGCLLQHYAFLKNEGKNKIPSSIDWTDILTFFVVNDCTTPLNNYDSAYKLELPVLEYETSESVSWKPSTGTSWITIKGDLYYQYNGYKSDDTGKLTIINNKSNPPYYTTSPVDKAVSIDAGNLYSVGRRESSSDYNHGFSVWKMKLQIGDKYWGGDDIGWVNYPTTFYIKYNDNPDSGNLEAMAEFGWMSPVNNRSYKDKVGVDGYCIPIAFDDIHAPVMGKMHLTIYTPAQIASEVLDILKNTWPVLGNYTDITWNRMIPVIYCKDFELGFVYTDTNVWYNNHEDDNKADKVYVGYIDEDYKQDFSELEFKLNTALKDKPISRSFVTTSSGYLSTLKHKDGDASKTQEYNVIDMYLDHHSERKPIYETNLHGYYHPRETFVKEQLEDEILVVHTQNWDVAADNNRITLIAY